MSALYILKESKQISKISISLVIVLLTIVVSIFTGCGGNSSSGDNNNNPQPQPQTYSVSFITNGGSSVPARNVQQGGAISVSPDTTREGYIFEGWFTDNNTFVNKVNFPYAVTGNITLYANWTPIEEPISDDNKAVLNDNVKVLNQQDSETFINFAQPIGMVDNNLVITIPSALNLGLSVGDIFMVRPTSGNPMGVTAKVEQINGNEMTISQPAADEVFSEFSINVERQLSISDIIDEWSADGVTPMNENSIFSYTFDTNSSDVLYQPADTISTFSSNSKLWHLNKILFDKDGNYETTNDQIHLSGEYGFKDATISVKCDACEFWRGNINLDTHASVVVVADTKITAGGNYSFGLDDMKLTKSKPATVFDWITGVEEEKNKIMLQRILFDIGTMTILPPIPDEWFPTGLAVSLEITSTLEGQVNGTIEFGVNFEMYAMTGFKIDGGAYKPENEIKDNITGEPIPVPHFRFDAEVKFSGKALVGLDIAVYVAGVKLTAITNDFGLFVDAELSAHTNDLEAEFTGSGQIALKIVGNAIFKLKVAPTLPLFGKKTLVDLGKEIEIYNIPLWAKNIGVKFDIEDFNTNTYVVYDISMTWLEAKAYCETLGGHLVTITSQDEQTFIAGLIQKYGRREDYYIGATEDNTEGNWVWITGEPWQYSNWDYREPNDLGIEYIAEIYRSNGRWNDLDYYEYSNKAGFICEWETFK